jgi:hypothetical protein
MDMNTRTVSAKISLHEKILVCLENLTKFRILDRHLLETVKDTPEDQLTEIHIWEINRLYREVYPMLSQNIPQPTVKETEARQTEIFEKGKMAEDAPCRVPRDTLPEKLYDIPFAEISYVTSWTYFLNDWERNFVRSLANLKQSGRRFKIKQYGKFNSILRKVIDGRRRHPSLVIMRKTTFQPRSWKRRIYGIGTP